MPPTRPPETIEYVSISLRVTRQLKEALEGKKKTSGKSSSQIIRDGISLNLLEDTKAA